MTGPETTAAPCPALTPVLTFSPRATVWLCCIFIPPALTFVLIFIFMVSFLEKWIEVDCDEGHRSLSQVGESHWILLANIFSAHGVPIGAESDSLQVATTRKLGHRPAFSFT